MQMEGILGKIQKIKVLQTLKVSYLCTVDKMLHSKCAKVVIPMLQRN